MIVNIDDARKARAATRMDAERAEARRLHGRWEQWSNGEVDYMLGQIGELVWDDDELPMIARAGVDLARNALGTNGSERVRLMLNGIWWITDMLLCLQHEDMSTAELEIAEKIHELTAYTACPQETRA